MTVSSSCAPSPAGRCSTSTARRPGRTWTRLQALVDDLAAAADVGRFEDPDLVVTRTPLELHERAFKKLNRLLARTLAQALTIAEESAARSNEATGAFPTELGILHFKRALPSPGPG